MKTGVVRRGDIDLAYSELGEGPSTLLLVMGLGGNSGDWGEPFPRALARLHRVIMIDNRGTGRSTRQRAPFSLHDLASDAMAVLDALSVERAHVLGISMGGVIAQLLALDHAARVDRLVLLSTFAGTVAFAPPPPEAMTFMMPTPGMSPAEIVRARVRAISAKGFAEREPDRIEALVALALAQPTPLSIYGMQVQALLSVDVSARLAQITARTLVVHGDADPLVPFANGRELAARIPGASLEVLTGCGHLAPWEMPEALSDAVVAFLGVR